MQELYDVEHFAIKTVAVTFWRLPVIFLVMFIVRGQPLSRSAALTHNCDVHTHTFVTCTRVYTHADMFCWHACFDGSRPMEIPDDADT